MDKEQETIHEMICRICGFKNPVSRTDNKEDKEKEVEK